MKLSNETYDVWNKIQRWLPAVAVLYLTLSQIWNLPFGDEINKTIQAFCTFLAAIIETSTFFYNKKQKEEMTNDFSVDENLG